MAPKPADKQRQKQAPPRCHQGDDSLGQLLPRTTANTLDPWGSEGKPERARARGRAPLLSWLCQSRDRGLEGSPASRRVGGGGSLIPVPASCSPNCSHSTGSQSTKRTHRTGLGGVRGACCSPPSPQRAAPAVALAVQNRMVTEWAAEVQSQRARRRVPWSQNA